MSRPVIVNFIPFAQRSIADIRMKRDSDMAAGLTAYRAKKEKKATPKSPRKRASGPVTLTPDALATLDALDPLTRQIMMEAMNAKR